MADPEEPVNITSSTQPVDSVDSIERVSRPNILMIISDDMGYTDLDALL